MTRVIIDAALRARLNGLTEQVEFCDESGRTLGHFVPLRGDAPLDPAADGCPYSVEDLRRFRQETGGHTLGEVWKSLPRT
jgi:hypothetical protein